MRDWDIPDDVESETSLIRNRESTLSGLLLKSVPSAFKDETWKGLWIPLLPVDN